MNSQELGVAGELRVMSELILHGFNPAKSYIDNGIDIILENGIRIQVKTTNSIGESMGSRQKTPTKSYKFSLRKGNGKNIVSLSEYVDFLICNIPSKNIFLIIPVKEIKRIGILSIPININSKSQYYKYLNNWEVLRESSSS